MVFHSPSIYNLKKTLVLGWASNALIFKTLFFTNPCTPRDNAVDPEALSVAVIKTFAP